MRYTVSKAGYFVGQGVNLRGTGRSGAPVRLYLLLVMSRNLLWGLRHFAQVLYSLGNNEMV